MALHGGLRRARAVGRAAAREPRVSIDAWEPYLERQHDDPQTVLPGQPRDDSGPVFREPWEAQAFAMTLALHERGLFSWTEWARALAAEIADAQAAGDADLGDTYYRHWLAALEHSSRRRGSSSVAELDALSPRLARAAERTPHGVPSSFDPRISASRIAGRTEERRQPFTDHR